MKVSQWVTKRLEYQFKKVRNFFVSDASYLKRKYKKEFNIALNLKKPQTFNEKVTYRMISESDPLHATMADKITARTLVEQRIGRGFLVPLIGIFNRVEEIDFTALPNKFVIKCSHDSGSAIICTNKQEFSPHSAKEKLAFCLTRNMYHTTRERHYRHIQPRILCEEYIDLFHDNDKKTTPELYRVHCFAGKAKFIEVDFTDDNGHESVNVYNHHWHLQNVTLGHPNNPDARLPSINVLKKMLMLSEITVNHLDYCRVDWFIHNDDILFSEFTLTPRAGKMPFQPASYDSIFGAHWIMR